MYNTDVNQLMLTLFIFLILFRISLTDLREHRIGKTETGLLVVLGLIRSHVHMDAIIGGFVCAGIPELLNLFISGLSGLGGGDIRLMFAAGCLLGTEEGLKAVLFSGMLALLYAGSYCIRKKEGFAGLKLPFGPFLSVGIVVMLMAGGIKTG